MPTWHQRLWWHFHWHPGIFVEDLREKLPICVTFIHLEHTLSPSLSIVINKTTKKLFAQTVELLKFHIPMIELCSSALFLDCRLYQFCGRNQQIRKISLHICCLATCPATTAKKYNNSIYTIRINICQCCHRKKLFSYYS